MNVGPKKNYTQHLTRLIKSSPSFSTFTRNNNDAYRGSFSCHLKDLFIVIKKDCVTD